MAFIGKVTAGGNSEMLVGSTLYGYCETAAATAAKVVTISGFDTLMPGVTIHVMFKYSNTAASPTLNVSGLGAKPLYKYGTTVAGNTANTSWVANSVVSLTYSTSVTSTGAWIMNDHIDNSTYTVGNKALKLASDSGTATQAITVNENSADRTATIKGDGTYITGAVSGSANEATVTLSHAANGTAGSTSPNVAQTPGYNTTFNIPVINYDAAGHITSTSTTTVKIPASDNTDRYVNSASFTDDSTATAASPVKMTLTRAGSDTATVTANIPKVSASSAGVVPKGAAVTTQSTSTKFLREDGTWAAPSYISDTDTKVTQTVKTDSVERPLLTAPTAQTATTTTTAAFSTNIKANASTGNLTATKFTGDGSGINVGSTSGNSVYTTTDGKLTSGSLATTSPNTGSSPALDFIATVSQDAKGKITATKQTVKNMTGSNATTAGVHGLVPAPGAGTQNYALYGDGTWKDPVLTIDNVKTTKADGKYAYTSGSVGYITGNHIPEVESNKSFYPPATAVKIEYSTNAGSTWTDYGATDNQKVGLFTENRTIGFSLGKGTSTNNTNDMQLRVTIEPTDRYARVDHAFFLVATNGNSAMNVSIECSTIGDKTTFSNLVTDVPITGWSGPNVVYFPRNTFGGGPNQTNNKYAYRFTFKQTVAEGKSPCSVGDIRLYGDVSWTAPNYMMRRNHLYTWDNSLNATFPAKITATSFSGALTGNASSATEFSEAKSVTLTGDVTGTASSKAGWSVATTLANSGVTSGTYGPTSNQTPQLGGTITIPSVTVDAKGRVTSASNKTATIPTEKYGVVDSTSTNAAYTVTVPNLTSLYEGAVVYVYNNKVVNAASATLNVNSLGAKSIYYQNAVIPASRWPLGSLGIFVYNTTIVSTGCWIMNYSYGQNTTYSNASLGTGYGTCTTAAATAAKAVTLASYTLAVGGYVSVKFSESITVANATLNIDGKGAKPIFFNGAALAANVIKANDIVTFVYDGTNYNLVSVDGRQIITAGSYGPTANVTGTEGTTIKVPQITVDDFGRVTSITERTLTNKDTTYIVPVAGTASPKMDGTATVGTSAKYAREDHIHPSDTNKLDVTNPTAVGKLSITINSETKTIKSTIQKNASDSVDYGTQIIDYDTDDNTEYVRLILRNETAAGGLYNSLCLASSSGTIYKIYGEHNRPIPSSLGFGYGICATDAATVAKTATLTGYELVAGGIVSIKFTYAVPASATLSINSQTAKAIQYNGSAVTAGIIQAGDLVTFIYDGSYYHVIGILQENKIIFSSASLTLATSRWSSSGDTTYPYKAVINMPGVTENFLPVVQFRDSDTLLYDFSPVATTGSGTITIMCKTAPTTSVVIPQIICYRGQGVTLS